MTTLAISFLFFLTLPGTLELALVLYGWTRKKPSRSSFEDRPVLKLAVLIPAHNEELHIKETIHSLKKCQGVFDFYVILDHCTDRTGEIAVREEANIIQREDPLPKGKPQSLQTAFQALSKLDYEGFIILDADSSVDELFVETFQDNFRKGFKAIQTKYVFKPTDSSEQQALYSIAFSGATTVRANGRQGLNLSCGIFGNGWGITKEALNQVPFETHSLVEDLVYHIHLVSNGLWVFFSEATVVSTSPPKDTEAESQQRNRWQGGKLQTIWQMTPAIFIEICKGKFQLIEPLLDLLTLPMAYQALALIILMLFPLPRLYAIVSICLLAIYVWIAQTDTPVSMARLFKSLPRYLLNRLSELPGILSTGIKRYSPWLRTKR